MTFVRANVRSCSHVDSSGATRPSDPRASSVTLRFRPAGCSTSRVQMAPNGLCTRHALSMACTCRKTARHQTHSSSASRELWHGQVQHRAAVVRVDDWPKCKPRSGGTKTPLLDLGTDRIAAVQCHPFSRIFPRTFAIERLATARLAAPPRHDLHRRARACMAFLANTKKRGRTSVPIRCFPYLLLAACILPTLRARLSRSLVLSLCVSFPPSL